MDGARCLGVSCLMAPVAGSGVPEIGCYQFSNQGSDPNYVSRIYFDKEYRSVGAHICCTDINIVEIVASQFTSVNMIAYNLVICQAIINAFLKVKKKKSCDKIISSNKNKERKRKTKRKEGII